MKRHTDKAPASDAAIVLRFAAIVFTFGFLSGLVLAHVIYCGTL